MNLLGSDALTADSLLHNVLRNSITIIASLQISINMSATDNGNSTFVVKAGLAKMLKGGVIMDVSTLNRLRSLRQLAPLPSWPSREYLLISDMMEV